MIGAAKRVLSGSGLHPPHLPRHNSSAAKSWWTVSSITDNNEWPALNVTDALLASRTHEIAVPQKVLGDILDQLSLINALCSGINCHCCTTDKDNCSSSLMETLLLHFVCASNQVAPVEMTVRMSGVCELPIPTPFHGELFCPEGGWPSWVSTVQQLKTHTTAKIPHGSKDLV